MNAKQRGRLGHRTPQALGAGCATVLLGIASAWPLFDTAWVWITASLSLLGAAAASWVSERWRLRAPASLLVLIGVWVTLVVPAAVPQAVLGGPPEWGGGLLTALSALQHGWKQLLTVPIPVGDYQGLLVTLFTVLLCSTWAVLHLGRMPGRAAGWAAIPLTVPVLFGTVWGSTEVSAALRTTAGSIEAPREIALWCATGALAVMWVAYATAFQRRAPSRAPRNLSGAAAHAVVHPDRHRERRRHRRRDRTPSRVAWAVVLLVAALGVGVVVAPALTHSARAVPRASVLPELVVTALSSPLAGYHAWKQDALLDQPLFTVTSTGEMPHRIRIAVLDAYDGDSFTVSATRAGAFTRYPLGVEPSRPVTVTLQFEAAVAAVAGGVWLPVAGLGSAPEFQGERARSLTDTFFVNRDTDTALVLPGGTHSECLREGDGYRAVVSAAPPVTLTEDPADTADTADPADPTGLHPHPDFRLTPALESWLRLQHQPATAAGLTELVQRLRDRGYLSHGLSGAGSADIEAGHPQWVQNLAGDTGYEPIPSAGGHNAARIDDMFAQLTQHELAAGAPVNPAQLVAAVGDDEQFATAGALLARALGYDSRVVIGVRMAQPALREAASVAASATASAFARASGVPDCVGTCTGANVAAWVEVRQPGGTWATLDVTPQHTVPPSLLSEGAQLAEFETVAMQRDAAPVDMTVGRGETSEGSPGAGPEPNTVAWWWGAARAAAGGLVALMLLALPIVTILAAKRWRRHKRRTETDSERSALAAWYELCEALRDGGVTLPSNLESRTRVAEAVGSPALRWVAAEVDRAVWSAEGLNPEELEVLWAVVDAERYSIGQHRSRWQRGMMRISPRTLFPPSSRSHTQPGSGALQ